ncbi:MAG: methyltransferase domain-containing protein [Phycisphaeraceae bacterium]|nr:methyltransferase domain-containing protein [Phycisphaeraceae bacterium]
MNPESVDPVRGCRMGGKPFFLRDPEDNRLEVGFDSPWSSPEVVARFSSTPPNAVLMRFAARQLQQGVGHRLLDIGCGAGCNAVPLARLGWDVLGIDLSGPMLEAADRRAQEQGLTDRLRVQRAPMDRLPIADDSFDFIVAHGIWNLARSSHEFLAAVREAARVARSGAPLFVYTFSLSTFPPDTKPIEGEPSIFTQFSGRPQCFLTEAQLIEELHHAGFDQEPETSITEYPQLATGKRPAILEGIFRRRESLPVRVLAEAEEAPPEPFSPVCYLKEFTHE